MAATVPAFQGTVTHLGSVENMLGKILRHSRSLSTFVVRLNNRPGALEEVLRVLREDQVNLTRIESRPVSNNSWDVFLDAQDESKPLPLKKLSKVALSVDLLGPMYVPWFPRAREDLDVFSNKTLDAGSELESDHPGFTDLEYRERRNLIVTKARTYKFGKEPIPTVDYTDTEIDTWEYQKIFQELEEEKIYSKDRIPQLQELNSWLRNKTGFALRPVTGLLSARDFLNGLAVKCFHSTQYIRHSSKPFYTPEPDVVHELMGHVPMLGDPAFASLSHDIGLASLGASDSDIKRLATVYWFSVEFGLVYEDGKRKGYGAGLLSSFGELEHSCQDESKAEFADWDPEVAAETAYPITTYQPKYFVAKSLESAAKLTRDFCHNNIKRPFYAQFEDKTGRVIPIDRKIRRKTSVYEEQRQNES